MENISLEEAIARNVGGPENYKKWSSDYERFCKSSNYSAHEVVVEKLLAKLQETLPARNHTKYMILDAGCGTGLIGEYLQRCISTLSGVFPMLDVKIYGGDLCQEMLDIAKTKNIYVDLSIVNLKEHLPYETGTFDSVLSAGVFLPGLCGPECIPELVRVLKRESYLITTVRKNFYEETNAEWKKQIKDCSCELLQVEEDIRYIDGLEGVLLVIYKT